MASGTRKAILLQDVDHLGARGDVVNVSRGYLRNYLVPRRLAEEATDARIREIQRVEAVRSQQQARSVDQAQDISKTLTRTILTIPVLAGAGDRLYGSVTAADIADEIWRTRKIRVDRRKVQLEEPIKRLGTYQIDIEVFPEVTASVKTMVVPAEGSTLDLPVGDDDDETTA
jgi:large subunit ribosomal protein L9